MTSKAILADTGSAPGSGCYGHVGEQPTVTDAKLVIGILDPENFGNRRMTLKTEPASASFASLARRLDMDIEQAYDKLFALVDALALKIDRLEVD